MRPAYRSNVVALLVVLSAAAWFGVRSCEHLSARPTPSQRRVQAKERSRRPAAKALAEIQRARADARKKHWDGAQEDLLRAGKLGQDARTLNAVAWGLFCLRDYSPAYRFANKAVALQPDNARIVDTRGRASLGLGRTKRALRDFDRSLELDPSIREDRLHRSWALEALGRYAEAEQAHTSSTGPAWSGPR